MKYLRIFVAVVTVYVMYFWSLPYAMGYLGYLYLAYVALEFLRLSFTPIEEQ